MSTVTPRAAASSCMLSASTSGTPSSASSAVKVSVRRRFLASPTCTRQRVFSSSRARIVARSSSLREGRASTPGVSSSIAALVEAGAGARDFDRGAGVVGDVDVGAGQAVEEHRLADVGVADEEDGAGGGKIGCHVGLGVQVAAPARRSLAGVLILRWIAHLSPRMICVIAAPRGYVLPGAVDREKWPEMEFAGRCKAQVAFRPKRVRRTSTVSVRAESAAALARPSALAR